uniref:Predicted gene 27235 n=1 Tax=Mus musculus TaxID=10090 RepID=Q3UW50_MOUSE|nr:unnamed protein product [Mus musculus]
MKNFLRLCLFLLCFETGFPLQCVQCQSYKNGECATKKETCTTKPGETCMIRRTWYANETILYLKRNKRKIRHRRKIWKIARLS